MTTSNRNHRALHPTRRILCCWFPGWSLQHRLREAAASKPSDYQLIYAEAGRRGRYVVTASRAARRRGVHIGMPLAEAQAMLPESTLLFPYDPQSDQEALQQLAVWAHQFSPHAAIETPPPGTDAHRFSPESLLSDVTHTRHYFGGEWNLLRQLAKKLVDRHLKARLAVAHSIGAAWALAHAASTNIVAAPDYRPGLPLPPVLANLPVASLRLPAPLVSTLRSLGLESIGQLAAIPEEAICLRLDAEVVKRLHQFLGLVDERLPIVHETPRYQATTLLDQPARDWQTVDHYWTQLADQVAQQLAEDQRGAVQLDIELATSARTTTTSIHLSTPHTNTRQWLALWELQRESLTRLRDIHRITLTASVTARPAPTQPGLLPTIDSEWSTPEASSPVSLDEWAFILDRLTTRIPRQAIFRPRLLAEPLPERSWSARPPTRRPPRLKPPSWNHFYPAGRPLHLCPQPIPIATRSSDQLPQRFYWSGRTHYVRQHWGPQLLEGGWWQGGTIAREYYHIETREAKRFWIFYCRHQQQWYLHGWDP